MKFEIKNRWTGAVQFTAEIDCDESASYGIKVGLAVKWGVENKANLQYADMQYANLQYANLQYADMQYANLQSANLRYADMQSANLQSANLQSADLQYTDMQSANLRYANLRYADMQYANLRYADLRYADMQGANLRYVIGNMREVKSMQIEKWTIVYTHDMMAIGCQNHLIEMWRKSDPRWIAAMDNNATEWWNKFGKIIIALIDASPAIKPEPKK